MHLEIFSEGNSLLHKVDPRIKLVTFIPIVFIIATTKDLITCTLALAVAGIFVAIAKLNIRKIAERIVMVNLFILLLWLFIPFSYTGHEIARIGALSISKEGVYSTTLITFKANAIFIFTITMLGTSRVFSLAHALLHLKVPVKLVYMFFFCYRYITLLHEEYERLIRAALIRGFKPKTNIHTYKTYAYLAGMLIVRSYERAERIYKAMLCRGFTGKFPIMIHFQLKNLDYMFVFSMMAVIIMLIMSEILLYT
ncbi:MAG: cobalt ECF transporter T component CbiQ [Candidatus Magnetoovum sp. WYHC-5]|nr:cobalt ECF transporter T component CbiQ [Candidatus Magnetoovum sp. WYHC-5]